MWQGGGETLVKVPFPAPPNPNLWSIKPTARHVVTFVLADILIDYVTETLLLSEGDAARLSPEADHGWLFPLAAGEGSAHSCSCLMKVKQTNKQAREHAVITDDWRVTTSLDTQAGSSRAHQQNVAESEPRPFMASSISVSR